MEVYKTIDVDECTMCKEQARKCKDLDRRYRYSPRGKGEDTIAKQACLVQTQTTKARGPQDNCQELKVIMYNDIRSKILVSQVSDRAT